VREDAQWVRRGMATLLRVVMQQYACRDCEAKQKKEHADAHENEETASASARKRITAAPCR
jgi:hypothetical protein